MVGNVSGSWLQELLFPFILHVTMAIRVVIRGRNPSPTLGAYKE